MSRVPLPRVTLAVLLYPLVCVSGLAVIGVLLPAQQEGEVEVVLLAIRLVVGFALGSWWCLVAPLFWAAVAFALGFGVPLENTDPREGQMLVVLVAAAGLVPLGVGIAARQFKRRSSAPKQSEPA
jgi:hypothetical protein